MLYREMIVACAEGHAFCEHYVEFFGVKHGSMGTNNWALRVLKKTNVDITGEEEPVPTIRAKVRGEHGYKLPGPDDVAFVLSSSVALFFRLFVTKSSQLLLCVEQ
jgi:hypothetical protein